MGGGGAPHVKTAVSPTGEVDLQRTVKSPGGCDKGKLSAYKV